MKYNHKACEDEDDAARMAECILRELGYIDTKRNQNKYNTNYNLTKEQLIRVARFAERIARWARKTNG